jgi:dGTPase
LKKWRVDRLSGRGGPEKPKESRSSFERDCDRILYSGAFRRLAVITQVVSPAGGHAFHNRLTHALKVAQVGRRIAQRLIKYEDKALIRRLGGIEPTVVEAAALAHDLGHPPFGHIAEEELHRLVYDAGIEDGFEGNAQSFRIVTRLDTRDWREPGLDLTRATLDAMLKYPRHRGRAGKELIKFGAYADEANEFLFAHKYSQKETPCIEAQIMDWADDITYAVHDLEDFYRLGKIPLDRMAKSFGFVDNFLEDMFEKKKKQIPAAEHNQYREAARDLFTFCPVSEEYLGTRTQRAALRGFASAIIHEAVTQTKLSDEGLVKPVRSLLHVALLKQLTFSFFIEDSSLASEQYGKRYIIRKLFEIFANASQEPKDWKMFPPAFQEQLADKNVHYLRTTADYIASMGEQRAVELYAQLSGSSLKPFATGLAL